MYTVYIIGALIDLTSLFKIFSVLKFLNYPDSSKLVSTNRV